MFLFSLCSLFLLYFLCMLCSLLCICMSCIQGSTEISINLLSGFPVYILQLQLQSLYPLVSRLRSTDAIIVHFHYF